MSTIFMKIINKEIPASIVYEDEKHIAFLDISPISYGHTLVIPKKEYAKFIDMPEDEYANLQKIVQKISKSYKEKLNCNIGSLIYGEDVQHVHIHIIPITNDIKVFDFSKVNKYEEGEMEKYKNRLQLN